jgi:hypothetical protein
MIKLELTLEDVNRILAGLGELPAKESIDTIIKIRSQAGPQVAEL